MTAAPLLAAAQDLASELKPNAKQPYIVKPGDTLWDIAEHFFKDPYKWLKIWERNPHITNPDLIYPGDKVWLNPGKGASTALVIERVKPKIHIKPVERMEKAIDPDIVLTALLRHDRIESPPQPGIGHIVGAPDDRFHFGMGDTVYLKLNRTVDIGDILDVYRISDPIYDPERNAPVGVLVLHLGQVEILSKADGLYRATVRRAFEELARGDQVRPAKAIKTHITPIIPEQPLSGSVLYIREDATEAGQHQVISISLGEQEGVKAGTMLAVYRAGKEGEQGRFPSEKIGEILVLEPQEHASIAIVLRSTSSINRGDLVRSLVR